MFFWCLASNISSLMSLMLSMFKWNVSFVASRSVYVFFLFCLPPGRVSVDVFLQFFFCILSSFTRKLWNRKFSWEEFSKMRNEIDDDDSHFNIVLVSTVCENGSKVCVCSESSGCFPRHMGVRMCDGWKRKSDPTQDNTRHIMCDRYTTRNRPYIIKC